jgi:CheY-like chemotaxis protein
MGQTVLVVDDSDLIRDVTQFSLEKAGYVVDTIADPRGLAAALASKVPDVVLVDIGFPGVRPHELAALVKPHLEKCPFLVFSDRPAAEIEDLVAELGASGSVAKNLDGAALADALARVAK